MLAFLERLVADGRVEAEIVRIAAADIAGAMGAARPSTAVNA